MWKWRFHLQVSCPEIWRVGRFLIFCFLPIFTPCSMEGCVLPQLCAGVSCYDKQCLCLGEGKLLVWGKDWYAPRAIIEESICWIIYSMYKWGYNFELTLVFDLNDVCEALVLVALMLGNCVKINCYLMHHITQMPKFGVKEEKRLQGHLEGTSGQNPGSQIHSWRSGLCTEITETR